MLKLPETVQFLLFEFIEKGYSAHVVGGAVRDMILDRDPKDFDIITNCPLSEINFGKTFDIGKQKDFDIVNLRYGEYSFEVAHYEGSLKDNVKQRDFKVNSLICDVYGTVWDYVDALQHFNKEIIGNDNIKDKYEKDPIRMLRAIRQSISLGFYIEELYVINEMKSLINSVSKERIKDELFKMASNNGKSFAEGIKLMNRTGLLQEVMPCIHILKFFKERLDFHPESYDSEGNSSVFNHIIAALNTYKGCDPLVNLGILFHDVGKALTFELRENGNPSYHNHERKGLELIKDVLTDLKFSNDDINTILYLTENHMRIHNGISRPGKILKLVNHKDWNRLKDLAFCDDACRGPEIFDNDFFFNEIKKLEGIANNWAEKNESKKVISGNMVMDVLGIGPGPLVGKIIDITTDWIIYNDISDEQEIITFLKTLTKMKE